MLSKFSINLGQVFFELDTYINTMIKNKINKLILFLYFLTIGNYAHARVINVNSCPVPFDFTVAEFCVLSTIGMWIAVPLIIFVVYVSFSLLTAIIRTIFSK
jgi:hypothetical protein